ncbi:hypothetical protein RUND412_001925 [Rhizina undulata]
MNTNSHIELAIEARNNYHSHMSAVRVAFWSIYTQSIPSKQQEAYYKSKRQHLLSWIKGRQALEEGKAFYTTENNNPPGLGPSLLSQQDPPPQQHPQEPKPTNRPSRPKKPPAPKQPLKTSIATETTKPPPNLRKRKFLAPTAPCGTTSESTVDASTTATVSKKRKPTVKSAPQPPALPAISKSKVTTPTAPTTPNHLSLQFQLHPTATIRTRVNPTKPGKAYDKQKSTQKMLKELSKERSRLVPSTPGETEIIVNRYPDIYRFRRGKKGEVGKESLDITRLIFLCSKVKRGADGKALGGENGGVAGVNCAEGGRIVILKRSLAKRKLGNREVG